MSVRLQGQFLLAGAIGEILASLLIFLLPGPEGPTGPGSIPTNLVFVMSGVLLLIGLPALYRTQAKQIRLLGLIGVVLLWVATICLFFVLSAVKILGVAVPGLILHPGGEGPPLLAIISMILGVVLTLIGGCDRGNHDDPGAYLRGSDWLDNHRQSRAPVTHGSPEWASWGHSHERLLRAFLCWPGLGGCDPQLPWEPHAGLAVFGPTQLATNDQDAALSHARIARQKSRREARKSSPARAQWMW
jgi:hypothetical protein